MTGTFSPPQTNDLANAYSRLQHLRPQPPNESAVALYSQWARFDPRLAEIWVKFIAASWQSLNPIALRSELIQLPWPGVAGVLLEFSKRAISGDRGLFNAWMNLVLHGLPPGDWEQFFIGQHKPGGKAMFDDARFSLAEYRKWGYLGRAILFNKQRLPKDVAAHGPRAGTTHTMDFGTRIEVIRSLLEKAPSLTARDYREATENAISARQAERDLLSCSWLAPHGSTRGRYYTRARRGMRGEK